MGWFGNDNKNVINNNSAINVSTEELLKEICIGVIICILFEAVKQYIHHRANKRVARIINP